MNYQFRNWTIQGDCPQFVVSELNFIRISANLKNWSHQVMFAGFPPISLS